MTEGAKSEEAETHLAVVRVFPPPLGSRDLIRLDYLRLIMSTGQYQYVPTRLGLSWYGCNPEINGH